MHLLDLAELPDLDRALRLFGHNRARPVAFSDADHLGDPARTLRANIERFLRESGAGYELGRVELLTHCRVFGYVFNPVSFFYCYDSRGHLAAVVAEVNNTFGERHPYLLEVRDASRVWTEKKVFHVSPFLSLAGSYRWEVPEPSSSLDIRVDLTRGGSPALAARLRLKRQPLTDATLLRALVTYPLMTAQVIGAIHWQAARLWLKKVPVWTKPPYDPGAARGGPA